MGLPGALHDIVETGIVTAVTFNQKTGCRHFVSVEDRAPLFRLVHLCSKDDRHPQPLVGDDYPLAWRESHVNFKRLQALKNGLGNRDIKAVFVVVLISPAIDAIVLPEVEMETRHLLHCRVAGINQQDLVFHRPKPADAVENPHLIGLLDRPQCLLDFLTDPIENAVKAAVPNLHTVVRVGKSLHLECVPAKHRTDQHGSCNLLIVLFRAQ